MVPILLIGWHNLAGSGTKMEEDHLNIKIVTALFLVMLVYNNIKLASIYFKNMIKNHTKRMTINLFKKLFYMALKPRQCVSKELEPSSILQSKHLFLISIGVIL